MIASLSLAQSDASKDNRYVLPSAIEPITGYLPDFTPITIGGGMYSVFEAKYTLVRMQGQDKKLTPPKSANNEQGHMTVKMTASDIVLNEVRVSVEDLDGIAVTELTIDSVDHTVDSWTMVSSVKGVADSRLEEAGSWDGSKIIIDGYADEQQIATQNPLIARWALLPMLASGELKQGAFVFDMLDYATHYPNQKIVYEGVLDIPTASGFVKMDSYVQIGWGTVPTHYLVDMGGRVQLITNETVNWVLSELDSDDISGMSNVSGQNLIRVYPNPSKDGVFFIDNISDFTVFSQEGKVIKRFADTYTIDLSVIDSGLYVLLDVKSGMTSTLVSLCE